MNPRNLAIAFTLATHLSTAFQPRVLSSLAYSVRRSSSTTSISMDSGLTLYGSQQTRSPLVNWYLEEKAIPFTQKAPRPSAHPFGQTPFLTDDGGVEVFESGAILLYIADAYGGTICSNLEVLLQRSIKYRILFSNSHILHDTDLFDAS